MPSESDSSTRPGSIDEAMAELREARLVLNDLPDAASRLISALETVADFHREAGDSSKAESCYLEAIETAEKEKIPPDSLARLCSSLAMVYDFSQREAMAAPLYERAIELYEGMKPPRLELAADLHNNLAMIYKSLDRKALAEQHYLVALESLENLHGREHERVAAVYNNLGSLYYAAGHTEQAREMHKEALDIRRGVFGENHPETAQSWCNLATACYSMEDDAAAKDAYEKGLRILEHNLPRTASSYEHMLNDYTAMLESIGEEKKAAGLRKRMAKVLRRN